MTRTPKQTAQLVEDTINQIKEKGVNEDRIALTCVKNKINENVIRTVAGWEK